MYYLFELRKIYLVFNAVMFGRPFCILTPYSILGEYWRFGMYVLSAATDIKDLTATDTDFINASLLLYHVIELRGRRYVS